MHKLRKRSTVAPAVLALSTALGACVSLEFEPSDEVGTGGNYEGPIDESTTGGAKAANAAVDPNPTTLDTTALDDATVPLLDGEASACAFPELELVDFRGPMPSLGSTASAIWARHVLARGQLPDPTLLRLDEFRSYYAPPPESSEASLALSARAITKPGAAPGEGEFAGWVPLEIYARFDSGAAREPLRVVVVVDASSRMHRQRGLVRSLLASLPGGLDHADDQLAVLSYAGDVRLEVPLGSAAESAARLVAADIRYREGNDLRSALEQAFALGDAERPVHVLLATDGASALDPTGAIDASRIAAEQGARLSVALLGEPAGIAPAGGDPAELRRGYGDALTRAGLGKLFYLGSELDVADVVSGAALGRSLGVAGRATGIGLTLPSFFTLLVDPAEPTGGSGGAAYDFAPARSYVVRLPALVCSSLMLTDRLDVVSEWAGLALLDAEGSPALELPELSKLSLAPADWVDVAIVATVGALRTRDTESARSELAAALEGTGCVATPTSPACASLTQLEGLLAQLESNLQAESQP